MNNNYKQVDSNHILPGGLSISETEKQSARIVEETYIRAFAEGHPRFYVDERCGEEQMIRANPDGSEDLVHFNWQTRQDTFIKALQPAGKGVYAYLLNDPRFTALKNKE